MRDYFQIALQYCDDVRTGVRTAGKLEKLAVKRFLNDLTRSGCSTISDNPDVDYGFSRNERIVLGIAVVSLAAATVLGINYKEDRVQENYDRNVPEHVDSDSNSGQ